MDSSVAGSVEQLPDLVQGLDRIDIYTFDDGCFARIGFGYDEIADASFARSDRDGEHSGNGAKTAVESELTDEEELTEIAELKGSIGAEDPDGHREVEAGAFLLDVSGSEIDGDVGGRNVEAGVLDGSANAVSALAYRGIGQTHGVEVILGGLDA